MNQFLCKKPWLLLLILPFATSLAAETLYDDEKWGSCSAHNSKSHSNSTSITKQPFPDAIYLQADKGTIRTKGVSSLQGDVIIQRNDTQFNADRATYDRATNLVEANGHVILSSTNLALKSPSIKYDLKNQTGTIKKAEYVLGKDGAHGKSEQIQQIDRNHLELQDATFTTCPVQKDSWHFKSSQIQLNNKTQIGTAKDVTLRVADVPVFYFPWLKFPLNNQRLSGFLTPNIRLQSNAGITIPYYFNLASNYDATVSLSVLNKRGFKFDTEFRYLTEEHQGKIEYDFMADDRDYKRNQLRDYFKIDHHTKITDQTKVNIKAQGVSDKEYFEDFSTSLQESTQTSLQRRLEVIHKEKAWTASAAVEDYQILDTKDAPYAKLPELRLNYAPKTAPKDFKVGLDSELIYFDKDNDITGTRASIKLKVSKKWGDDSWFFKPSLTLQYTAYSLNKAEDNSLSRTLPTFTLDSGLFFDRELKQGRFTQTLEPRIFYTHTPYKDQSKLPIFDTALTDFSAPTQLFHENRFTGKDRIADTNQLTFAVTSRIQNRQNGKELFKASIGQVFSFSDKKVTMPGGTIQPGKRSDLVLELSGRLNDNFKLSSTSIISHKEKRVSGYELRLNYQDEKKRIANISYRKLDSELKQLTLSGSLPINDRWSVVSSFDRDINNNRTLEALVGVEYQDCCWKTRIVAKRFLTSDNKHYETPIFLEFELKGLGNIGSGASRELKEKIYGYDDY